MIFLWFTVTSCAIFAAAQDVFPMGHNFVLSLNGAQTILTVHNTKRQDDIPVWSTKVPFLFVSTGSFSAVQDSGNFKFTNIGGQETTSQTIDAVHSVCDNNSSKVCQMFRSVSLSGKLDDMATYKIIFSTDTTPFNTMQYTATVTPIVPSVSPSSITSISSLSPLVEKDNGSGSRISMLWDILPTEEVFGFGEQYTQVGLKGTVVPIVTTEQGVGRGKQPVSDFVDLGSKYHNAAGNWHTTYTAIPHYITSLSRSMFVKDTRYMTFDFASNPTQCNVTIIVGDKAAVSNKEVAPETSNTTETLVDNRWSLSGNIYHGNTPKDVVEAHTNIVGR